MAHTAYATGYCRWDNTSELNIRYHDGEWGVPLHDDRGQFEFLMMEVVQREIDSTHEFEKHMAELGYSTEAQIEPELEHSITSGMFAGVLELVFHDVPKDKALRCVRQLYDFYTAGWRKLMGM